MLRSNQDGFDMARLQKHIKRQQRSSFNSQYSVTKLSPAEIRDLNNAAIASKNARLAQLNRSLSSNSVPRSTPRTPPLSPDELSTPQVFPGHHIYTNLPTPPISPDHDRKDLAFANYAYPQTQNGRPQSSGTSNYSSSGPSRRPSNASSYRGVTQSPRSGSMTLFQDSAQQIVTNPLSNFSRPRQSALQSPYERYRTDQPISRQSSTSQKSDSSHRNHSDSSSLDQGIFPLLDPRQRVPRPILPENSDPEDRIGREPTRPPALRIKKKRSRSMPALMRSRSPSIADTPLRVIETLSNDEPSGNYTALPQGLEGVPLQKHFITETDHKRIQESKQKRTWRKTFNTTPDKSRGEIPSKAGKPSLTGNFSNASLISISYADTVAGEAPQMKASLKEVLPSNRNPAFQEVQKAEALKSDFGQHPAVRPYSVQSDNKSVRSVSSLPSHVVKDNAKEEKDQDEHEVQGETFEDVQEHASPYPTYSRCSCCGKLRKPVGFTSNLSPVLENEHLRTNFSFELGRTSIDSHRHCSSSSGFSTRPKHIPIIPMEIDNQMRQATIEPYRGPYAIEESPNEEQRETSRPGSAVDSGFVTAENTPTDNGRLSPISRSGSTLAVYPPPIVLARGKDEPKVVRFANLHQRKREIERRGRDREQKVYPGQEQMHSMSQIDNLYPETKVVYPPQISEKLFQEEKKEIPDISPLTSSASSSEVDLVSRMPKPPVSSHRKVTSSTFTYTKAPEYEFSTKPEPPQVQQIHPLVDLSSLDGTAHRAEVMAITEARPVKQVITISAKEPHSDSSEEDEYAEIARSSPFSEEELDPPRPNFFARAKSSSSPNSSDEALPLPPPSGPNGKTTTTVRIVNNNTIPIPERSPKRPQTASSVHEPLRLGDWVLPTATTTQTESQVFQPYQHYAAMKFDGIVSTQELPTPLSASSSRYNSLTGEILNPSTSSSLSFFQVQEAKNAQVTQVVTGGNVRVKEVGSSIARRMRAARRSTSIKR